MPIKVKNFIEPYVGKIDSLRIEIPISEVEIIDKTLIEKLYLINSDAQVIKEKKGEAWVKDIDGINYRFWAKGFYNVNTKVHDNYLVLLANAKMLHERYFEGLNQNNIDFLLENLNKHNVVNITKESLLKASVSDVDFCFDFFATPDELKKVVEIYQRTAIVGRKDIVNGKKDSNKHVALYLNSRNNQYPAKPYLKFYHKSLELKSKSEEFASRFLDSVDFENVARCEVNMKNYKYFERFGLAKQRTVSQIFSLRKKVIQEVFVEAYKGWFEKRVVVPKSNNQWYKETIIAMWRYQGEDFIHQHCELMRGILDAKKFKKLLELKMSELNKREQEIKNYHKLKLMYNLDDYFRVNGGRMMSAQKSTNRAESNKLNQKNA